MGFLATLKNLFVQKNHTPTLTGGDRMLSCCDCHVKFIFDEGEQRFFKDKGFTDPKRCPRCRKKVRVRMRKRDRRPSSSPRRSRRHSMIDGESPYVDER